MGNYGYWKKLKLCFRCMSKSSSHDDNVIVVAPKSSTNTNSRIPRSPPPPSDISHLKQFTYNEVELATRNFRPGLILGEGGFGKVFKGWISCNQRSSSSPRIAIAVKTLNKDGNQGHKEWEAEINCLGALQHPNLVKLIGYCSEDEHRMLVYEYMQKGCLENHLFRRLTPLPWTVRIKIMLGAAKGLAFLHEEAEKPLIYRDFKTSNILLDSQYNAKLSDFGLAKDAPTGDKTHVSTQVMGTQGYVDPLYAVSGHLTSKSDVYSFGIVLLEMLTGRQAIDYKRSENEQCLVEWAKPYIKSRIGFHQLIDPKLEGIYSARGAYKALKLVSICLCRNQNSRPLMSEVVKVLQNIIDCKIDMPPLKIKSNSHAGPSSSSSVSSTPTRFQASPLNLTAIFPSNPPCGENP